MGFKKLPDMKSENDNLFDLANELVEKGQEALRNCRAVCSLELKEQFDGALWTTFHRNYYVSKLENGEEVYILTTDEPNRGGSWNGFKQTLYSTFEFFPSIEEVIQDIERNSVVAQDRYSIHGPPLYVHYNVVFIEDSIKKSFLDHINNELLAYSEDYIKRHFDEEHWERINYWREYLEPNNPTENNR
jgi:hypothetical protein